MVGGYINTNTLLVKFWSKTSFFSNFKYTNNQREAFLIKTASLFMFIDAVWQLDKHQNWNRLYCIDIIAYNCRLVYTWGCIDCMGIIEPFASIIEGREVDSGLFSFSIKILIKSLSWLAYTDSCVVVSISGWELLTTKLSTRLVLLDGRRQQAPNKNPSIHVPSTVPLLLKHS